LYHKENEVKVNKEISALFSLIDDPDEELFSCVSDRIVTLGAHIIPNLEDLWENAISGEMQERIELLIHRLHFQDLITDFIAWRDSGYPSLLLGALLVAKFQHPNIQSAAVLYEVERIRKNIWLELNGFLTPLERAHVINSILYSYYNLKGCAVEYTNPDNFFIHKTLQTRRGNAYTLGILYLVLTEALNLPVRAIDIPNQFVLAFFKSDKFAGIDVHNLQKHIHFFIDTTSGFGFSHNDLLSYFGRINEIPLPEHFQPLHSRQVIKILLNELIKCFSKPKESYKVQELKTLINLLEK
jgi:hypothetical protein